VLERFGFDSAPRAGKDGVLVGPRWVGGQVAFCRSHLVDPPRHKLSQAHEGVGAEGGGIFVVRRRGVFFGPFLEEHAPSNQIPCPEGALIQGFFSQP